MIHTPETFDEQLSRVQQMAHDANGETWDLSRNDRAALLAILASHTALINVLKQALAEIESNDDDIGAIVDILESQGRAAIAKAEGR